MPAAAACPSHSAEKVRTRGGILPNMSNMICVRLSRAARVTTSRRVTSLPLEVAGRSSRLRRCRQWRHWGAGAATRTTWPSGPPSSRRSRSSAGPTGDDDDLDDDGDLDDDDDDLDRTESFEQERTSGSWSDSYDEGSRGSSAQDQVSCHSCHLSCHQAVIQGYRIPYRLMRDPGDRDMSPPPQPTHRAPGILLLSCH